MTDNKKTLIKFVKEYKELLAKYPSVSLYSVSTQELPRAYSYTYNKKGDVVSCAMADVPTTYNESRNVCNDIYTSR